jgi:3-hydroxyisobutyrate dehydrogenase-like beta-hydroxyacid dehydrogenase
MGIQFSPGEYPTVGVIGLGDIGSGVAGRARAGRVDLVVCDIRPESTAPFAATARVAEPPAELGPGRCGGGGGGDRRAGLAVLDGATGRLAGPGRESTVVIVSTVAPSTVARVAELAGAAVCPWPTAG